MKKPISILLICALLLMLTACQGDNSSGDTSTSDTSTSTPDTSIPDTSTSDSTVSTEGEEPRGAQMETNLVKKVTYADGSEAYVPILGDIVYDGGELELYLKLLFIRTPNDVQSFDATAFLFVDGYMQEFSLGDNEKALMHNVTVQNNETGYYHYKFTPATYDTESDEHYVTAVILVNDRVDLPEYRFTKECEAANSTRKIILNTINTPRDDNIIKMENRDKAECGYLDSELPYIKGDAASELSFHCSAQGETRCYVFCDGKLLSQDGKYIFKSDNDDENAVSFADISVSESDIGKPLYVLYVPKEEYAHIWTTANYLRDEGE